MRKYCVSSNNTVQSDEGRHPNAKSSMSKPAVERLFQLAFSSMWMLLLLVSRASARSDTYYDDSLNYQAELNINRVRFDPCTHASGKPKFCQPEFVNLARRKPITVSSSCKTEQGDIAQCDPTEPLKLKRQNCSPALCQRNKEEHDFKVAYFTDESRKTCWATKPLRDLNTSHVNITINFNKKYVLYYIALMDCGQPLPDSLEIMKSVDFGVTWQRWHLFSKNCERDFGITGKSYQYSENVGAREIVCTNIKDMERDDYGSGGTISFSTNYNRKRSTVVYESDPLLIDWMTATDMKIIMHKYSDSRNLDKRLAFSNIDIGGRCLCNGHASECVETDGKITCECQHGTEGADCERCKPFWVDLPWARGTELNPTQCKPCNCNSHSQSCRFSPELYKSTNLKSGGHCVNCRQNTAGHQCHECMSGYHRKSSQNITDDKPCQGCNCHLHSKHCAFNRTLYSMSPLEGGGSCLNCGHNTAGRFCQYCKPGFHRNWTLPESHYEVCNLCNCHPLGSRTNICNRKKGICECKTGVEGEKCDTCKRGFEPTDLPHLPCRKIVGESNTLNLDNVIRPKPIKNRNNRNKLLCHDKCKSEDRRLTQVDYCLRQWAVTVRVTSKQRQKRWIKISAEVEHSFKCHKCNQMPTALNFLIKRRQWRCRCPRMQIGRSYLVITREKRNRVNRADLVLDKHSIVWEWEDSLRSKIHRYENVISFSNKQCRDCDCVVQSEELRKNLQRKNDVGKKKLTKNADISVVNNVPTFKKNIRIKTNGVRNTFLTRSSKGSRASFNRGGKTDRYLRVNSQTNRLEDDIPTSRTYSNYGQLNIDDTIQNGPSDSQIPDIS